MSDTMHRAVFTIACLRSRLPVPAIDVLAASSWLHDVVDQNALNNEDIQSFLQSLIDLQQILPQNAHRLTAVSKNERPSSSQEESLYAALERFQTHYEQRIPASQTYLFMQALQSR
jgi:hypothetical protein